jgi:hypothetical protein
MPSSSWPPSSVDGRAVSCAMAALSASVLVV